jgi:hypothetical protein
MSQDPDMDKNPKTRARRDKDKDNNTISVTVMWPRDGIHSRNSSNSRPRAGPGIE